MRLTLREYLDKWYELDKHYDRNWEITIWHVETGHTYGIYGNETYPKMYDKYVRNDNLKRIVHFTEHLYQGKDRAIYVFVKDEPTDNPEINMFENFKKEQIEKRVSLWNEAWDEHCKQQNYLYWFAVSMFIFMLALIYILGDK